MAATAPPALSQQSDASLMQAVAERSDAALAEVFRRHHREVHRAAAGMRGSAEADDVVQEVFLRLWNRPQGFDADRGTLGGYLAMQSRGRAIDLTRTDAARRAREDRDEAGSRPILSTAEDRALEAAALRSTWSLLDLLSEAERTVLSLAYLDSRTYREVAVLLGEPEGTVKSRIRSGLRHLREVLVTDHPGGEPDPGALPVPVGCEPR